MEERQRREAGKWKESSEVAASRIPSFLRSHVPHNLPHILLTSPPSLTARPSRLTRRRCKEVRNEPSYDPTRETWKGRR